MAGVFEDAFKPYSRERRGDLLKYLRECEDGSADNLFYGIRHFPEIVELGVIDPRVTWVRVGQSPVPDIGYSVTPDFKLRGMGAGEYNMSCVGAPEGIYDPRKALRGKLWSIINLRLPEEEPAREETADV
jgi:hypothetical protein